MIKKSEKKKRILEVWKESESKNRGWKKKVCISLQIIDVNIEEERQTKSKGWNERKKVSLNVAGVKDVAINMT